LTSKSLPGVSVSDDEKRLLLSLLNCLGEWCMRMPQEVLAQPTEDGKSLLQQVLILRNFRTKRQSLIFQIRKQILYIFELTRPIISFL
jgi:hypothetical protein